MATRAPGWVPAGAWLAPGYAEWQAPAPLRSAVACLWTSVVPNEAGAAGLILPDACSDLIWEQGAGCYVAGPDTGPARTVTKAGTVIVGVRFRPSAGGQVLGLPLSEIRDQRVPVADLLPAAGKRLSVRQLRRRCHAAAGYGPKTLQRVLRFQRFVRMLDAAAPPPDLASAAALAGYADQAHLTRECAALSGLTPAALARVRGHSPQAAGASGVLVVPR